MPTILPNFNYSVTLGVQSLPAAIVFVVLYAFLLAFFIRKSFTHPTYVHYILSLFCVSKYLTNPSSPFQEDLTVLLSASRRVYHTICFSRLENGRRVTEVDCSRASSFSSWLFSTSLFGVYFGLGSVSPGSLQNHPV